MIYKFRVQFEDYDDVYRDIDMLTIQTFEDFKIAILNAIGFDTVHECAFYLSDDLWRRGRDLTKKKDGTPATLSKRVICDFVDAPHQRFLFVYDLNVEWSFLIELIKIIQPEPKQNYPTCVKSFGTAPKQYKIVHVPAPSDDEDNPTKGKRGRKPSVKKELEPIANVVDDDDINEDDVEVEEEVNYIEEADIQEGFGDEGEDETEKSATEDGDDEFGTSFGDKDEGSFGGSEDY